MTTTTLFTNRATAKLAVAVASIDTALTLVPGGGDWFPSPGANEFFRLVLQKGSAQNDQREYMICTSRTGDVLTVTRGQEGTPAANFAVADEVSLVATALTMGNFVQKVGLQLQGALTVEADPVAPLGIATKQMVTAAAFPEAPQDTKDYARRDAAWHALGAAAGLAVPIPITAGGTGGTTLPQAQLNLIIGLTSIDDLAPASPKYGDRWIKPSNMTEMVWVPNQGGGGTGVWVNPADAQSEAYPISIAKGGTGATTAAAARTNLGIDPWLVPVKLQDGTVAAPGLAWASEPGFGWYRNSASIMSVASQGAAIMGLDASAAASLFTSFQPRVASGGAATLILLNGGGANANGMTLGASATSLFIDQFLKGTATALPFVITNTNNILVNTPITTVQSANPALRMNGTGTGEVRLEWQRGGVARWYIAAPTTAATGDNFAIVRCNDAGAFINVPLQINRANGQINLDGFVQVNGFLNSTSGGLGIGGAGSSGLDWRVVKEGAIVRQYVNNSANLRFENDVSTGTWSIVNQTGSFRFTNSCEFWTPDPGVNSTIAMLGVGGAGGIHMYQDTAVTRRLYFNTSSYFDFNNSNGNLAWYVNSIEYARWESSKNFVLLTAGHGYQDSAEPWRNYMSDGRMKDRVADYTKGLDELLRLRPRRYHFNEASGLDANVERVGYIAQECETAGLSEMVVTSPMARERNMPDLKTLTLKDVPYMMHNAIISLHKRIAALEKKPHP